MRIPTQACSVILIATTALLLSGCGGGEQQNSSNGTAASSTELQSNICILLDLSDRIEPTVNPASPSHVERDLAAVSAVVDHFKAGMRQKGAFFAKGRIRTIFSPTPSNATVNEIAQKLSVDLDAVQPQQKKAVFDSLSIWYSEGLSEIYSAVLESSNYVGADIWRFFSEGRVDDLCIAPSDEFDNTLVIVTDGYLYHEDTVRMEDARSTYVTGPLLDRLGLRTNDWSQVKESMDAGLIVPDRRYDSLRVLVVEVDPSDAHADDYAILQSYWREWFEAMGIDDYRILKTDIPANTSGVILRYLENE